MTIYYIYSDNFKVRQLLTLLTGLELLSVRVKRPSVMVEYATEPRLSRPAPMLVGV